MAEPKCIAIPVNNAIIGKAYFLPSKNLKTPQIIAIPIKSIGVGLLSQRDALIMYMEKPAINTEINAVFFPSKPSLTL